MIVLLVILAVLILLTLTKVGVDAAYGGEGVSLAVKLGPVRKQLLPRPPKPDKAKKPKKAKKEKPKKKKGENEEAAKPKPKLDLSFILNLAKIALHALNRFRISLRIDLFRLRFIMASDDPYTTAMTYGCVQAAIGMLAPRIRRAFTVRESQVEMGTDFLASKPEIEARLVLTIRIGRIFGVLFATGFEFLRYMLKRKQREAKAVKQEKLAPPPVSDAAKPAQMSA